MLIELPSIHDDVAALERQREAVETARRRTIEILAVDVIVRAMARALEAVAVVAIRHFAAEMDAYLIQRQPVGAVGVLGPALRIQEHLKLGATHQKLDVVQMHDVGLGLGFVEDALLVKRHFPLPGGDVLLLGAQRDRRAKLASQVWVQHGQRTVRALQCRYPQGDTYRAPQDLAPSQALALHLGGFSAPTREDLVFLRRARGSDAHVVDALLEIEVYMLPGPDPQPAGTAEVAADQHGDREEER